MWLDSKGESKGSGSTFIALNIGLINSSDFYFTYPILISNECTFTRISALSPMCMGIYFPFNFFLPQNPFLVWPA